MSFLDILSGFGYMIFQGILFAVGAVVMVGIAVNILKLVCVGFVFVFDWLAGKK